MILLLIYRMISEEDLDEIKGEIVYVPNELEKDEFIHFSFRNQLIEVANAIYQDYEKLIVLEIETEKLENPDTLRIEDLYDYGEEYPHLYSPLNLSAIISQFEMKNSDVGFKLVS